MEELTILQDNVPQFDDKVAMQMINDSLGRPLEEVFSSISSKPVAAASLGQVSPSSPDARLSGIGALVWRAVQRSSARWHTLQADR